MKESAQKLGIDIVRYGVRPSRKKKIASMHYERIEPGATYAPWRGDEEFLSIFEQVKDNTLVDIFRLYELWQTAEQMIRCPGDILEIGVWRGGSGALLAAKAKLAAAAKKVYLCDTFGGVVKASSRDSSYDGGEHSDTSEDIVRRLIGKMCLDNVEIKKGIFPDDFLDDPELQEFCLVHIDVDVYQSAKDIFEFVWPRIPANGVVIFDDFGFETCDGIAKLVGELRNSGDRLVFHNLNGHAVIVKTACLATPIDRLCDADRNAG